MKDEKVMPFMGHLFELRDRLKVSLIVFIVAFFLAYAFSGQVLTLMWQHFLGQFAPDDYAILAESVMSGFVTQLNLAFILATALSLPVLLYELFMFIEPALNEKHSWIAIKIMLSAIGLFALGAAFVYFVMLPMLLEFFIESNSTLGISNYFSVESFFEFIMFNMFVGGLMFELPLIIIMANRIGLLPKQWLTGSRRIVYVVILVIAGIITPDHSIISQMILGGVMVVLFEISLLFSK